MQFNIIYKTTNLINGKIYVGKHVQKDMCPAMSDDYLGSGKVIKSAIRKYGRDNFIRDTLEVTETEELCFEREECWIAKLDARNPKVGYNIQEGGEGQSSEFWKKKWQDPMFRKFQSDLAKERWKNPEYRNHILKVIYKNNSDPKMKEYLSSIQRKLWQNPEYRERFIGNIENTPEKLEKHSIFMLNKWQENEYKEQQYISRVEAQNRPEVKEKLSKIRKGTNGPKSIYNYIFESPKGELFETRCLVEFCEEHIINPTGLSAVANGKRPHYKGWKCLSKKLKISNKEILKKYVKIYKTEEELTEIYKSVIEKRRITRKKFIYQLKDPVGIIHTTDSMVEFCKNFGLINSCMNKVVNGKAFNHRGWSFVGKKLKELL